MASTGEVANRISRACDQASKCRDALGQAQDLAEDAHDIMAAHLRGVVHLETDTEQVLARFTEAENRITDLWKILGNGMDSAQAALTALTGNGNPLPTSDTPRPAQPPRRPPEQQPSARPPTHQAEPGEPPVIPPERVQELRRELPPPVVRGAGQKTHGRWIGPDGTRTRIRYTGGAEPWWR